ncbi:antibiotic biosynthesis monooxygenase [Aurantimonas sp. C2-6-R+9]|uniref:antibiotic biosynthesis monooxygenase family protein n=1 Tax=unclassified Aurantimonas TaxID=2638230 RepID=UPI002E17DFF8|nr:MULTISPECIES: antibiotic biosynthesis monooxygenase [unclassified Aurantimonas]MEC5293173.1 antibiotic biosynthesis monooxygenase [Aurantimonas sp. C2-3-R2]MEC5383485.1 antibiotic biosynthesis monooxygenase [Aurantimonas sp. C2-6-R+9]MEC5414261.1 antibiotic biosynthesis monooxygenase [Aurantimonas sp. C2-4-R8]
MIVVVFQVEMNLGKSSTYFDIASRLRAELEKIDGFLSVERFESLVTPGKYLSLSFWRDEAAVLAWREHAEHSVAQKQGKAAIFADFRITVAEALRDYRLADRQCGEARGDTGGRYSADGNGYEVHNRGESL